MTCLAPDLAANLGEVVNILNFVFCDVFHFWSQLGKGDRNVHGENAGSASNIENDLVFEDMLVLNNGIHVGPRADFIFLLYPGQWDVAHGDPTVGCYGGEGVKQNIPTSPRECLSKEKSSV